MARSRPKKTVKKASPRAPRKKRRVRGGAGTAGKPAPGPQKKVASSEESLGPPARPGVKKTKKKRAGKKPPHRFPASEKRATRKGRRLRAQDAGDQRGDTRQRLQRVLAAAGLGSRRACEELITAGRVEVDRQIVTELGTRVDPVHQQIRIDGEPLPRPKRVYVALNKPKGVVCSNRDPKGRPRAVDLVPEQYGRLFPVGRLDLHSSGLILLTNDGEMANRLAHPRYGIQKIYRVQVAGVVTRETLEQVRRGVYLAEGVARVTDVRVRNRHKNSTILEMILDEGKNREIRRVLARVGHKVMTLTRVAVGPVRLAQLAPGDSRRLAPREVSQLRRLVHLTRETPRKP